MKTKGIKTLVVSLVAIVICFTMLLGTTFAWFTDSVTSSNNIIASGSLDVNAYWMEGDKDPTDENNWIEFNGEPIFNNSNWESGHVEAKHLKIANEGTLAFKYQLHIVPNGSISPLADVIDVYFSLNAQATDRDTITNSNNIIGTLADVIAESDGAVHGILLPEGAQPNNANEVAGSVTASMAFKMRENVGNEYQGLSIGSNFDIQIIATQYSFEEDTFGNDYDADAEYPEFVSTYVPANTTEDTTLTIGDVSVTIPAGAQAGSYRLEVADLTEQTNAETNETTLSMNVSLFNGNEKASGETYPVAINVGVLKNITKLTHNGDEITNYNYNVLTGILSFETDSFSPFEIICTDIDVESSREIISEVNGELKIVSGTFKGVDPATLDSSLAEEDSAYMVVEYEKGGEDHYVVAEKATTVVLNPTEHSGKLYSIISGLQNNEHSTVFLMPGTYNEGTTINVYSSMDIIGLGNIGDVEVVKQSSSSSNRHLFNVSGTKADYIQVTISNMTLDATAKTTNSKDNAAVQCIRKSKVKCYDLNIIKGTGLDAVAFYVNGNNAVDGVKYTAYLYAENCTLNTTRTFGIVTTSGTYKFYHTDLTYAGNNYTQNSGSTKNYQLPADNWEWTIEEN